MSTYNASMFSGMVEMLSLSWYLRSEIVPCLVGPPGIGKTAAVMQHARDHGCGKVIKIVASRCIPSETVGMTMPDHEHRTMDIYNSMQLSSLEDNDILFLDELLEADQFVLSTMLTLIESRELADGTPLPDVQIIAATNDTITPEQLKGNIRQRFMFRRFSFTTNEIHDYILSKTNMDIPDSVLRQLRTDGNDYNFLSPRSLTKLCMWVDSVPEDKLPELGNMINEMWKSNIGGELVRARRTRDSKVETPETQVRKAVSNMIRELQIGDVPDFEESTMSELFEMLQGLPEWKEIESRLADLDIEEAEEEHQKIQF